MRWTHTSLVTEAWGCFPTGSITELEVTDPSRGGSLKGVQNPTGPVWRACGMGVPGSDPFEKDVFPVKFVRSLQGFPRSKTLPQGIVCEHLGLGVRGRGEAEGVRDYFSEVKVLQGRRKAVLCPFFLVSPATRVGENEKHKGSSGQKQLFESPHKAPNTVGKNVLENYGMQIICGANPLQIHFLKCSLSPDPTRMKNRSDYTGAQRKATKKGNRFQRWPVNKALPSGK